MNEWVNDIHVCPLVAGRPDSVLPTQVEEASRSFSGWLNRIESVHWQRQVLREQACRRHGGWQMLRWMEQPPKTRTKKKKKYLRCQPRYRGGIDNRPSAAQFSFAAAVLPKRVHLKPIWGEPRCRSVSSTCINPTISGQNTLCERQRNKGAERQADVAHTSAAT